MWRYTSQNIFHECVVLVWNSVSSFFVQMFFFFYNLWLLVWPREEGWWACAKWIYSHSVLPSDPLSFAIPVTFFQRIGSWADSFIESRCHFTYLSIYICTLPTWEYIITWRSQLYSAEPQSKVNYLVLKMLLPKQGLQIIIFFSFFSYFFTIFLSYYISLKIPSELHYVTNKSSSSS